MGYTRPRRGSEGGKQRGRLASVFSEKEPKMKSGGSLAGSIKDFAGGGHALVLDGFR